MSLLTLEAKLERADSTTPWGFRMQGGKDFSSALTIQRVTPGSLAAKCGLQPGDIILKIGNTGADTLRHKEAQDQILTSGNRLDLLLQRGGGGGTINSSYEKFNTPTGTSFSNQYGSPASNTPSSFSSQQNFNTAAKPFGASSTPSNRPYGSGVDSITQKTQNMSVNPPNYQPVGQQFSDYKPPKVLKPMSTPADRASPENAPPPTQSKPTVKAIMSQKYNTPIGLYSNENVVSTFQGQSKFLLKDGSGDEDGAPSPGQGGSVRTDADGDETKVYHPSETYKMVREHEMGISSERDDYAPAHSRSFKFLQQQLGSGGSAPTAAPGAPKQTWKPSQAPSASAPVAKPWAPSPAGPPPARPGGAPPKPTGVGAVRGKKGDAVVRQPDVAAHGSIPRAAMCASCSCQIRGPFVVAMGKSWCPDHFTCANPRCGRKLIDIGFVEEGGFLYCEKDYETYFAPHCAKCGTAVVGECVNALQQSYHPHCFTCAQCRQPIGGNQFHIEDGKPYCENDWSQMFQTMCSGCQFPIEPGDRWVEAMSQNFHSECFNCSTCQVSLEGQPFYVKGGKPFCKKHVR